MLQFRDVCNSPASEEDKLVHLGQFMDESQASCRFAHASQQEKIAPTRAVVSGHVLGCLVPQRTRCCHTRQSSHSAKWFVAQFTAAWRHASSLFLPFSSRLLSKAKPRPITRCPFGQ